MRFLITAGNTREKMDRVRDWGNIFTGNTGYAIAKALATIGQVELLTSNAEHRKEIATAANPALQASGFVSHADLKALLEARLSMTRFDAVLMTAAVADYSPAGSFEIVERKPGDNGLEHWVVRSVQAEKVKSHYDQIAFAGRRTEKLVDLFRTKWNHTGLLVKFKLEVGLSVDELVAIGQLSRTASGANYLVANTLEMVDGPDAGAYLLSDSAAEWVPRGKLPDRLCQLLRPTTL